MTPSEIETLIVETLRNLQQATGETPCEISAQVVPLSELGFFDSLLAIETTLVLEERLGGSWDDESVFSDKETAQPLTIAEIAAHLAAKQAA
jgi:acyl carrier protein